MRKTKPNRTLEKDPYWAINLLSMRDHMRRAYWFCIKTCCIKNLMVCSCTNFVFLSHILGFCQKKEDMEIESETNKKVQNCSLDTQYCVCWMCRRSRSKKRVVLLIWHFSLTRLLGKQKNKQIKPRRPP